ncbi:MAG: antitoxin [Ignavibacteriales bacterium]|nr:MAG: antitoxin [Ignavibacteriales bacterium]
MNTAKLFNNGKSQAVRLPKAFRLKGKEAYITKVGDALIIFPKREKWNSLISSIDKFSEDFMSERIQPPVDKREILFK